MHSSWVRLKKAKNKPLFSHQSSTLIQLSLQRQRRILKFYMMLYLQVENIKGADQTVHMLHCTIVVAIAVIPDLDDRGTLHTQ